MSTSPGSTLAVIGAGVAGCALVAQLRRSGWQGPISLWEVGWGPGGRASTRRSREDATLRINHGSPLLNILPSGAAPPPVGQAPALQAPALLAPLLEGRWLEPWEGVIAGLDAEGHLRMDHRHPLSQGTLYRGRGGMGQISRGLLELAGDGIETHFGTLVRRLRPTLQGGWQLLDGDDQILGEADWLVLASTLLAHPRSLRTFGWERVPLHQASLEREDPPLDHVLATLAAIRYQARTNLLLVADQEASRAWRQLPFRLLEFDGSAQQRWGLSRLSIQPLPDGRCAVVAHSSTVFADENLEVVGSGSAMALRQVPPVSKQREEEVIEALATALARALAPHITDSAISGARQSLMRWGGAFPTEPGLPGELILCPTSRIGFCGDFVRGTGFGRIEGALRSAERLAALLPAAMEANNF